eukprot:3672275-Pleurochrysis_carterae.AAC.1
MPRLRPISPKGPRVGVTSTVSRYGGATVALRVAARQRGSESLRAQSILSKFGKLSKSLLMQVCISSGTKEPIVPMIIEPGASAIVLTQHKQAAQMGSDSGHYNAKHHSNHALGLRVCALHLIATTMRVIAFLAAEAVRPCAATNGTGLRRNQGV